MAPSVFVEVPSIIGNSCTLYVSNILLYVIVGESVFVALLGVFPAWRVYTRILFRTFSFLSHVIRWKRKANVLCMALSCAAEQRDGRDKYWTNGGSHTTVAQVTNKFANRRVWRKNSRAYINVYMYCLAREYVELRYEEKERKRK